MHKAPTFNAPMCLNVQDHEQTSLQAVPMLRQDTIRQNRLTQGSCNQSIWKYDCPSMTNQRHCKANSWAIAQAQDEKKKKTPLSAQMRKKERLCSLSKRDKNEDCSNADQGEMRFSLPRGKYKQAAFQSLNASYIKEFSLEKQRLS